MRGDVCVTGDDVVLLQLRSRYGELAAAAAVSNLPMARKNCIMAGMLVIDHLMERVQRESRVYPPASVLRRLTVEDADRFVSITRLERGAVYRDCIVLPTGIFAFEIQVIDAPEVFEALSGLQVFLGA